MLMTTGDSMAAGAPAVMFQAVGSTEAGVGEERASPFKDFSYKFSTNVFISVSLTQDFVIWRRVGHNSD